MAVSIQSGTDIIGFLPTMICLALLLIWGLFLYLGINVRKPAIRIASTVLLGISFSMLMGLLSTDNPDYSYAQGGALGSWVGECCLNSGMSILALILAWAAVIIAALLSTDWLFTSYIAQAIDIGKEPVSSKTPSALKDRSVPEPPLGNVDLNQPRPISSKTKANESDQDDFNRQVVSQNTPATQQDEAGEISGSWWSHQEQTVGQETDRIDEEAPKVEPDETDVIIGHEEIPRDDDSESVPKTVSESEFKEYETGDGFIDQENESIETEPNRREVEIEDETIDETEASLSDSYLHDDVVHSEDSNEAHIIDIDAGDEMESDEPQVKSESLDVLSDVDVKLEIPNESQEGDPESLNQDIDETAQQEVEPEEIYDLFETAAELAFEEKEVSIALFLNRMNIGYRTALNLMEHLEKRGVVNICGEHALRKVLVSREKLDEILGKPYNPAPKQANLFPSEKED